jgi:hypothetical protein
MKTLNIPNRPIPESYWILPGKFLAGEHPARLDEAHARQRLTAFLLAGFDTFIDLTRTGERFSYAPLLKGEATHRPGGIRYQRFPVHDSGVPSRESMTAILDALDAAIDQDRRVYLHCVGGIGRTGTVVGCYLVRHGMSGKQAMRRLNVLYRTAAQCRFYPHSPETVEQVEFIRDWNEDLHGRR